MLTQCEQVLLYMREVGEITPLDAMREFGIMRLGARIWDLKCQNYQIDMRMVSSKNRWGKKVSYAGYTLVCNPVPSVEHGAPQ